ncbi:MAG: hypothetical protein ACKO3R_01695 [bacterium]
MIDKDLIRQKVGNIQNCLNYDDLNISILEKILSHHLVDFEDFYRVILSWVEGLEA